MTKTRKYIYNFYIVLKDFYFLIVGRCVSVSGYAHVSAGTLGGQKRAPDSPELDL